MRRNKGSRCRRAAHLLPAARDGAQGFERKRRRRGVRPRRRRSGYSLNLILATWSSLLVEMSGVKSTRGPTRV
jgi:hypothetical protein